MADLSIRQIGRYKLLDVIGQGGMGIVYRAVDESIDRQVAIKMLLGGHAEDKDLLARFHREARSTANLQHKNIVTVYALDDFDGFPYMVMEYLEGQSIAEMIKSRLQLHIVEKIGLVCQVCEGLQYAHERSVIHRDIKPANVLVLKDNTAKIVDFGIARVGRSETLTRTGQIIGSIYYMSPEQISGAAIDARTDIYSTGVLLYQFLAGDLPFKSSENDAQGTFVKILNDPVPPLRKFLDDYPKVLDEVLSKAMAKDPAERYQTAEDFGYELSRIQEALKLEMASEYYSQAKVAIEQKNFDLARQRLQVILRFDRRNAKANELFQFVREQIQHQQRSVQIAQFRSQAQIAMASQQYEEALECVEQARRLDPADDELSALAASIKNQVDRARDLAEALRRGQAALYSGDLDEASQAVQRALQLEHNHTEARALANLISSELAERARRAQLQNYLDKARQEISNRNFRSALSSLQEAQAIDPSDSNIRELLSWARRGHEQEEERNELHRYIDDIGRLLGENRHADAVVSCRTALERFPNDASLAKLRQLAQRQFDSDKRRRAIEEVGARARKLADDGKEDEAIRALEEALQSFAGDPNLEMLLAVIRADYERKTTETIEREKKIRSWAADQASPEARLQIDPKVLASVRELQDGITLKLPMARLSTLADTLKSVLKNAPLDEQPYHQAATVLRDFDSRLARWKGNCENLQEIAEGIRKSRNVIEIDSLLDRARFLAEQYGQDDEIQVQYGETRRLASELKSGREIANTNALALIRSMQEVHDLGKLAQLEQEVQVVCAPWLEDLTIRGLVNQASENVREIWERRQRIRTEFAHLTESLKDARSAGQIRLLEDQSKMLAAESEDAEISDWLAKFESLAHQKIEKLEVLLNKLRDLSARVELAQSIADVERLESTAKSFVVNDSEVEEVANQLRRIQRTAEERRKEYRRIESNLTSLVDTSANVTGHAELDLILARQRDLVARFPNDLRLKQVQQRLQDAVNKRRADLVEASAESEMETSPTESVDDFSSAITGTAKPKADKDAGGHSRPKPGRMIAVSATCVLLALGLMVFLFFPRTVSIRTDPADARILIDSKECSNPCNPKLQPGDHELHATRNGYVDLHQTFTVQRMGAEVPLITLSAEPKQPPPPPQPRVEMPLGESQIAVEAGIPDVSVFVDDMSSPRGRTDQRGEFRVPASVGRHRVRIEKPGYEKSSIQSVIVKGNSMVPASFALKQLPIQGPANTPTGTQPSTSTNSGAAQSSGSQSTVVTQPSAPADSFVIVQAPAGAEIHIDEQVAGHSAGGPLKIKVPPGQRNIEVILQGYQPFRESVPVSPGEQAPVIAKLTQIPIPNNSTVPPSPRIPAGVSEADRGQIENVLNRYTSAVSQKDFKLIRVAWPDIPKAELDKLRDFARDHKKVGMAMSIERISLLEGNEDAVVKVRQVVQYDGKSSPNEVTVYMKKLTTGWIITEIPRSN
jgi:serine/threonine protein kinase